MSRIKWFWSDLPLAGRIGFAVGLVFLAFDFAFMAHMATSPHWRNIPLTQSANLRCEQHGGVGSIPTRGNLVVCRDGVSRSLTISRYDYAHHNY